jgi:hypothetical protein
MRICYYVTAHGFGHGVRVSAICGHFSPDVTLLFRTMLPRLFFEEEVKRPFEYHPAEFDCGCIQSDSVTVDVAATVETYSAIALRNAGLLDAEARWLTDNRVDGVVTDMPPFPLEAAARAGMPSAIATNFTWHDIYLDYVKQCPSFGPVVEKIRQQYCMAGLFLVTEAPMPMTWIPRPRPVPVVGRAGVDKRKEIAAVYGIEPGKRLGLIYTGTFGMDKVRWKDLERFTEWEFLGVIPLPVGVRNYRVVSKTQFRYQDLSASVDVVVSKVGYGTYAESVLHGVPLVYLPRADFAEFPALESGLTAWGHAYRLTEEDFNALRWQGALAAAVDRPRPQPWPNVGARQCAEQFEAFFGRA